MFVAKVLKVAVNDLLTLLVDQLRLGQFRLVGLVPVFSPFYKLVFVV